jgi:hypothetical protein
MSLFSRRAAAPDRKTAQAVKIFPWKLEFRCKRRTRVLLAKFAAICAQPRGQRATENNPLVESGSQHIETPPTPHLVRQTIEQVPGEQAKMRQADA